jgi:hypothetical protein
MYPFYPLVSAIIQNQKPPMNNTKIITKNEMNLQCLILSSCVCVWLKPLGGEFDLLRLKPQRQFQNTMCIVLYPHYFAFWTS